VSEKKEMREQAGPSKEVEELDFDELFSTQGLHLGE
jgi:hypothetical protein